MDSIYALGALIIGTLVIATLLILKKKPGGNNNKISYQEAKKRLDSEKGIILLDVRTKQEYAEKHIPKSVLIPVDSLEKEAKNKLAQKNAVIFVHCRSGNRSSRAVKILKNLGYTNVYNLGGILGWPYETVSGKK